MIGFSLLFRSLIMYRLNKREISLELYFSEGFFTTIAITPWDPQSDDVFVNEIRDLSLDRFTLKIACCSFCCWV
jgi:hypothetical protein